MNPGVRFRAGKLFRTLAMGKPAADTFSGFKMPFACKSCSGVISGSLFYCLKGETPCPVFRPFDANRQHPPPPSARLPATCICPFKQAYAREDLARTTQQREYGTRSSGKQ